MDYYQKSRWLIALIVLLNTGILYGTDRARRHIDREA